MGESLLSCDSVESNILKKNSSTYQGEQPKLDLQPVTLKDVPLEERRLEAKKPLFLTRYE